MSARDWDLLVIGTGLPGLALAADARRAGVGSVLAIGSPDVAPIDEPLPVEVLHGASVDEVRSEVDRVVVVTSEGDQTASVVVDTRPLHGPGTAPSYEVAPTVADRVHDQPDAFDAEDEDVLVIGEGERAVSDAIHLAAAGARVVLAFTGSFETLAPLAQRRLTALEHDGLVTVLWRSAPTAIVDLAGEVMATFEDRRTPDLVFDHVVHAGNPPVEPGDGRVVALGSDGFDVGSAWSSIVRLVEPTFPALEPADRVPARHPREIETLRAIHYNATITAFEHAHGDLWVLRVRPDRHATTHVAGQYATLGLGAWEPRADDAEEGRPGPPSDKMIRRSYSISSRILDDRGYLVDPRDEDEIEFYVVHVRPEGDRLPQLTPRLARKRVGDRLYLGPKVTGRYTLAPVDDPTCDVVLLATGTGEAPHNAMIGELLRRGHTGAILSAVTVRYRHDLAYEATHRVLEERFPNYRWVPVVTRDPDLPRRYLQDLITDGDLADALPRGLDPDHTHVFLCGNPAMIGLPDWEDDEPVFPEVVGVSQLLHERGFVLDRRGTSGNVHFEEYW